MPLAPQQAVIAMARSWIADPEWAAKAERGDLNAIRLGIDAKPVGNGQACASDTREIRRLGTEAVRVDGLGGGERDDQALHADAIMICRNSNIPASDR